MLKVGLTGGIGSGKSSVTALFQRLGVPVVDADEVAREVVRPGTPGLDAVVEAFGRAVVGQGGNLDRKRLRELVFADSDRRARLEAILHPRIRAAMLEALSACEAPYAVVAVPLLFESGWDRWVDRVLVVDSAPEQQIARAIRRDGASEEAVRRIMAAQIGREARLARADDVIDNTGAKEDLERQVEDLHRRYLELTRH